MKKYFITLDKYKAEPSEELKEQVAKDMSAAYKKIDGLEPAAQMLNRGLQNGYYRKGYCQFFGLDSGVDKGMSASYSAVAWQFAYEVMR